MNSKRAVGKRFGEWKDVESWKYSETDVLVELAYRLKLLGETFRCEVWLPSSAHKSGFMRCDLAVIRDGKIAFVVEVKHHTPRALELQCLPGRQEACYQEFEECHGIPVLWVRGMAGISTALLRISARAAAVSAVPWPPLSPRLQHIMDSVDSPQAPLE